jgi:hypothetical protein
VRDIGAAIRLSRLERRRQSRQNLRRLLVKQAEQLVLQFRIAKCLA